MSKDHWVSQFLLRSFAIDDQVQVFDKKRKSHFSSSTKKICAEHGFTTFKPDQVPPGMDGSFLEKELSRWESLHAGTLKKLVEERSTEAVNVEEFWELVRFAIWLHLCNPANRNMLRKGWKDFHLARARSLPGSELDKISLKCFGILLPHSFLRAQLERGADGEELLQSEFLGMVLKSADSSFNLVREEYAWSLADFKNIDAKLCTSDRPVLLGAETLQSLVGFGTPGAMVFFPLSPDLCLTGKNVGKKDRFVQSCNLIADNRLAIIPKMLMWAKSNQFVIAAEKSELPPPGSELPSYTPTIINLEKTIGMVQR